MTLFPTWPLDPLCVTMLRLSMALLFLSSALHKLRAGAAFRAAVGGYDLLPPAWIAAGASVVTGGEMLIGLGLLTPGLQSVAAAAGAVWLGVYSSAIAINLRRGRSEIECGCGGPAGRMPLRPVLLARNALLLGVCVIATMPPTARALGFADVLVIGAAVPTFALLYAAAETTWANTARERVWRARANPVQVSA